MQTIDLAHQTPVTRRRRLVLATDLDGTLLGGPEQDRAHLAELLRNRSTRTKLIFATGRGLEAVLPLLSDPLVPTPDYIIADVGATVVHGGCLTPVQPLQSSIAARWPGTFEILRTLERIDYLRRQDVPQERRCSFLLVGQRQPRPELSELVAELGCELLVSLERYVDVLPRGVSKGATLARLMDHIGMPLSSLLVAGDTLNDLSMFELDARGVVVGGAEPALAEAAVHNGLAYRARRPGAGGILEGLLYHDAIDEAQAEPAEAEAPAEATARGTRPLVMMYHRLPFDEYRRGGRVLRRRPKSPNGIIPSLLGFFANGREGSWVAWSQRESRDPPDLEPNVSVDKERFANLRASCIALTREDVELFYKRFSKEALWPVLFSFPGRAVFREQHWQHYSEVNRLFAERAAEEAGRGATVWIHDYNLWLVPDYLRQLRPDLRIAFFHHTAFPPADVFNILPWRREIVASLLQCDYIGFHTPRYVDNFVQVVQSCTPARVEQRVPCAPRFVTYGCALGVDNMAASLSVGDRTVRLGAHPVGIDVDRIERIVQQPSTQRRMADIRQEMAGRKCVLSIERLDYVKGPLEKVEALERLLEAQPELHGEVVLVNVVTPAADGMRIYRATRDKLDQAVGRVNGRFGRLDWTPIRYFFRSLPFEQVIAYCSVADVAWITPLRDGLNLVAKEYVAARGYESGDGVLVLSEFAGAAVELHGALLTNPYDAARLGDTLLQALTMDRGEREQRLQRLRAIVRSNDVQAWGAGFLDAVHGG